MVELHFGKRRHQVRTRNMSAWNHRKEDISGSASLNFILFDHKSGSVKEATSDIFIVYLYYNIEKQHFSILSSYIRYIIKIKFVFALLLKRNVAS